MAAKPSENVDCLVLLFRSKYQVHVDTDLSSTLPSTITASNCKSFIDTDLHTPDSTGEHRYPLPPSEPPLSTKSILNAFDGAEGQTIIPAIFDTLRDQVFFRGRTF